MRDTGGTHQLLFVDDIDSRALRLFQTVKCFRRIIDIDIPDPTKCRPAEKSRRNVFGLDIFSQNAQCFLSIERK